MKEVWYSMLLLVLLVSLAAGSLPANTGRWLVFGGLADEKNPLAQVELLALNSQTSYSTVTQWCSQKLSNMNLPLDGATVTYISVFDFLAANANNANFNKPYDGVIWDRALICGGADANYTLQNKCRWWLPETDTYVEQGPTMMVPRYQAAAFYKQDTGFLWMLGGRTGSNILIDNEVLWLPQRVTAGSPPVVVRKINKWSWLNKLALDSAGWAAIPGGMTTLPIPLAGHCVVSVQYNGAEVALVLGGGTTKTVAFANGTIGPVAYTGPIPTNHVHLFDFRNNQWYSTFSPTPSLRPMNVARMNHGCVAFTEGSVQKVMVAGGIGLNPNGQTVPLNSAETITLQLPTGAPAPPAPAPPPGASWFQEAVLPAILTGTKMILVNGRPTIVGRFGEEETNRMYTYNTNQAWEPLAATISVGRGDIQIIPDFTTTVPVLPVLSANTMASQGTGYNFNAGNMRTSSQVTTGQGLNPWVQLDFGINITITQVTFNSPNTCPTGATCTAAIPNQNTEVRVGYTPVPFDQSALITVNSACVTPTVLNGGSVTTVTCNPPLVGQYLTLQLKDPAVTTPVNLVVKQLSAFAATPTCTSAQTG